MMDYESGPLAQRGVATTADAEAPGHVRTTKWVYDFAEGSREMVELLGGKGAGIAEMTRVLGPELVPGGFTVTTAACVEYTRGGRDGPEGLAAQVDQALERLEPGSGR